MNRNSAHIIMVRELARASPHESLFAAEILHLMRKFLQRLRGNAAVKMERRIPLLVQKRFRAEDRMMREIAPAEDHRIRPDEAVVSDFNWLR